MSLAIAPRGEGRAGKVTGALHHLPHSGSRAAGDGCRWTGRCALRAGIALAPLSDRRTPERLSRSPNRRQPSSPTPLPAWMPLSRTAETATGN